MQISRRKQKFGKSFGLVPDYFADSLLTVDYNVLKRSGVKFVALDVDQTMTHNHAMTLTNDMIGFFKAKLSDGTLEGIFIASNSRRDLSGIAAALNAGIIRATSTTRKPGKNYYKKLLDAAGCSPAEIAMIGDRLLTDVLGGNRAGLFTILVDPTGPDLFIDRLLLRRFWGRQYLRRHL